MTFNIFVHLNLKDITSSKKDCLDDFYLTKGNTPPFRERLHSQLRLRLTRGQS